MNFPPPVLRDCLPPAVCRLRVRWLSASLLLLPACAVFAQTRTPWQMLDRTNIYAFAATTLGDTNAYALAPVPAANDPGWGPAPNANTIGFSRASVSGVGKCNGNHQSDACNFTYFQCFVYLPANYRLTAFTISLTNVDDGARISLYNSTHTNGGVVPGSYFFDTGNTGRPGWGTANLASLFKAGETNRVVITHQDDCNGITAVSNTAFVFNGAPALFALCTNVTVTLDPASLGCTTNVSVDNGSYTATAGDTITLNQIPPPPYAAGTNAVTLWVIDNHGMSNSCTASVVVMDATPPVILCPPTVIVNAISNACYATNVNLGTPIVSDGCGVAAVLPDHWWPGEGNAIDLIGGANGILQNGALATAPGRYGQAFSFDGVNDFVDFGPSVGNFGLADFSVDFWMKTTYAGPNIAMSLIGKKSSCNALSTGFLLRMGGAQGPLSGKLAPALVDGSNNNQPAGTRIVNDGNWHHVTLVRQNINLFIYVDGTLDVASATAGVVGLSNAVSFKAGNDACVGVDGTVNFAGQLDELEFFNRALSASQVQSLYNGSARANQGTVTVTNNAPAIFPVGTNIVTWTARDASGNTNSCTQLVIVRDTQPPQITCPPDVTVTANSGCVATNVALGTPITSDNCGVASVTNNLPALNPLAWWPGNSNALDIVGANNGILVGSYTNAKVGPGFLFNGTNNYVAIPYAASLVPTNFTVEAWINPLMQVSDPIDQEVIFGQSYGRCQLVVLKGTTGEFVKWQFGINSSTFYSVVSTTQIPIGQLTHIAGTWDGISLRLYINGVLNNTATPGTTPADSGCSFFIGGFNTPAAGSCSYVGQFFNGVIDEVGFFNRALAGSQIQAIYAAGSTGLCGTPTPPSICPLASFAVGTNNVTWTVTDISGNTNSCTQRVIVRDTNAPVITCPANLTLSTSPGRCDRLNVTFSVTAADCQLTSIVSAPPSGSTFPIGTTTVTNTATDSSGNQSVCTFTVTIADTLPPVLTCPANLTFASDAGTCTRSNVTFTVTATDNCDGIVSVTSVPPSGSPFPVGTTTVTSTATDSRGNTGTCTFTVTVSYSASGNLETGLVVLMGIDAEDGGHGPLLTWQRLGSNILRQAASGTGILVIGGGKIATDSVTTFWNAVGAYSGQPVTHVNGNNIATVPFAGYRMIGVASDVFNTGGGGLTAAENTTFATRAADIASFINSGNALLGFSSQFTPSATAAGPYAYLAQVAPVTLLNTSYNAIDPTPTGLALGVNDTLDICCWHQTFATYPSFLKILAYNGGTTAPAALGGSVSIPVFNLTCPAPTAACSSSLTLTGQVYNTACRTMTVTWKVDGVNVQTNLITPLTPSGNVTLTRFYGPGNHSIVLTANDGFSTQTCATAVNITGPTITCPANLVLTADPGKCSRSNVTFTVNAVSPCGGILSVVSSPASGSTFPVGTTTVTNAAVESFPGTSLKITNSCVFTVRVVDAEPPALACPPDIIMFANAGGSATNVNLGAAVVTDNCAVASLVNDAPPVLPFGTNIVTWTATDTSGNTSSCPQRVAVIGRICAGDLSATAITNVTLCASNPAVFITVASSQDLISYRWKFNGQTLPGRTNHSLVLPSASVADAGTYTVEVNTDCGAPTLARSATLTVMPLPAANPAAYTNPDGVIINTFGVAAPYGSPITPNCVPGVVRSVSVLLHEFTHRFPRDANVVLMSPDGRAVKLFGGAGAGFSVDPGVNLLFADASSAVPETTNMLVSGSYHPSDFSPDTTLPAPAPGKPYATNLDTFIGVDPNGAWKLFVYDSSPGDGGNIVSWSLNLEYQDTDGGLRLENPRMSGNGTFQAEVLVPPGLTSVMQFSTNLSHWIPVATNVYSNYPGVFTDVPPPQFQYRFYRAKLLP